MWRNKILCYTIPNYRRLYNIYCWILQRCNNINNINYKSYWWRWIKCKWRTWKWFYKDMWKSYIKWLQLDRINNDGNYCKNNCRWTTSKQNCRNTRKTVMYNWIPMVEVCENLGINYHTVRNRIYWLWWSIEKSINTPIVKRAKENIKWSEYFEQNKLSITK